MTLFRIALIRAKEMRYFIENNTLSYTFTGLTLCQSQSLIIIVIDSILALYTQGEVFHEIILPSRKPE